MRGDINITSGNNTNIIASNLNAEGSGNITAGSYLDLNQNSPTYGELVYNDKANLNILNGVDSTKFHSELTKIKTGLSLENALMTAAMVAAVAFSGGAAAGVIIASGAAGGAVGSVNKQKDTKTTDTYNETIISSNLNFGQNAAISSMNDAQIQASNIKAGEDLTFNIVNNLAITTASEAHYSSTSVKNKGNYFFKNGDYGNLDTNIINSVIASNTNSSNEENTNQNLTFNVGNAAIAQYNKDNPTPSYLEKLDPNKTVYNAVEETHKDWNQTTRGLTSAGQAVVAITATALTMGAMDPVNGSIIQGALVGGASATASTVAVSATNAAMNADGDVFKQLKTIAKETKDNTTSKESIKNIAIAAAAAGLATGLTNVVSTGSFTTPAQTTQVAANATTTERVATNFTNNLKNSSINTLSSSAAQSAINGDSFTQALTNQVTNIVIYAAAAAAANEIGAAAHGTKDQYGNTITNPTINTAEQLALHAALGAATAKLTGNDAASGAIAGVVGEIAGENLRSSVENQSLSRDAAARTSGLISAISTVSYGNLTNQGDNEIANNAWEGSRVGENAAANNALRVKVQPVRLGFYHTSITHEVEPGDEKFFTSDPRYQKNPETGKLYMTLGGGPDNAVQEIGKTDIHLIGQVNRELDVLTSNKIYSSPNLISHKLDMQTASQLYWNNQSYQDNLPYQFFPSQNSNGYNSNSYTAGLLNSVGINPPALPKYITYPTPWQDLEYPEYSPKIFYPVPMITPGYDKPIPPQFFGVNKP